MKEFIEAVKNLRRAQRNYFAARYGTPEKQQFLVQSKVLEKKVDGMIVELEKQYQ